MKTAVAALTTGGGKLARSIGEALGADVYTKENMDSGFMKFAGRLFNDYEAIVFVMACGIVVRAIAPYIKDKASDPAVVVVDEKGSFAISLLSGHLGGANKLAEQVAGVTGGTPVITTATDVNGVIAFDVFAKENNCEIENLKDLKYISGELVNGGKVALYSEVSLECKMPSNVVRVSDVENIDNIDNVDKMQYGVAITNRTGIATSFEKLLLLRPKNLVLGIGCRRGTPKEDIANAVTDFMEKNHKSLLSVKCVASIELKKDEEGIIGFCRDNNLKFETVTVEEIEKVEENYTYSDFVKEQVGVGGVAEPSAIICGDNAKLICKKTVYKGITLAMAEEERVFGI